MSPCPTLRHMFRTTSGSLNHLDFLGWRTSTVSVTVVLGRRSASFFGTKRPVPASRTTFFGN